MGFLPLEFEELNQTLPADFKEQGNDMLAEFEEPGQDPQVEFEEPVQIIPVGFEELGEAVPVEFDVAYVSGQRKPATVTVKETIKDRVYAGYFANDDFQMEHVDTERTLEGLQVDDTFLLTIMTTGTGQYNVTATGAKAKLFESSVGISGTGVNEKRFRAVEILVRVTDPVASVAVEYTETD